MQRHGLFVRRGSRLRRAATYRARDTCGMCPATALGASQHPCTCSPFTDCQCSIRRSSAPAPRPPSPPWLSARLRSSPSPPPALFSIILCSLALSSCCRGSLKGGMERQGGGQGGCCRATAQQQSSHGSDGPPARFQQLRRRFYARQLHAFSTRGLLKKMCTCERSFLALPACLRAGKHATRTPEARATRRYAACVLGPRTQNTTIPPTCSTARHARRAHQAVRRLSVHRIL